MLGSGNYSGSAGYDIRNIIVGGRIIVAIF